MTALKITTVAVFLCFEAVDFVATAKVPFFLKINYCGTPECKFTGRLMNRYLNQSVDPCDNFYRFSCDGWMSKMEKPESEHVWSDWQILAKKINDRIEDILVFGRLGDNTGVAKAARFYNACVDASLTEMKYVNNLKTLVKEFGGWPVVQTRKIEKYDWFESVVKLTGLLGVHPIFKITVNADYRNTSINAIYVEPGETIFPPYILREPKKYSTELRSYKLWIYQTVKYLYNEKAVKADVAKIIQLEAKLATLNTRSKNERTTLVMLTKKFNYNWRAALNLLNLGLQDNDTIVIKNFPYFKNTLSFLRKIDPTVIANYLLWYMVKDLSRETSPHLRTLSFMVDKNILGIKTDIDRKTECLNLVNKYFQNAFVPLYVERYTVPETLENVRVMFENIKVEYIKLIKRSTWLNELTKSSAIEKIKYLKGHIGFPKSFGNLTESNEYYDAINITSNHLHNVLAMKHSWAKNNFKRYRTVGEILWPSGPLEVNAFYSILHNAIFIPLGILESPFYNPNLPDALNYGALGSLIGHEISHALDTTGRQADKNGNILNWWTDGDVLQFERQVECYEDHYNNLNVNGQLTIGENIADNVGVEISFAAFKKLKTSKIINMVPHLETFSNEQLFYLAYSQMWCEISGKSDVFIGEEHAPAEGRVLGTLHNENFHKYFHCDRVDKKYCRMW